jgi:Zn-dependent metalloprotease
MECIHYRVEENRPRQAQCFIVPPFVLRKIAENGTEKQKKEAEGNIRSRAKFTAMRGIRLPSHISLTTALQTELNRLVYDAEFKDNLPGVLKRKEGQGPTGHNDVDIAYDYSADAFRLLKEAFDRNSIDNYGMTLTSTVRFVDLTEDPDVEYYNNASWWMDQMIYGHPDPGIFRSFLLRTVAAHEMGHGVVQYEGGLRYQKDTGAINEHFADVFGILAEQLVNGHDVNQSNWLIGEGIWSGNINGKALRSMANPGTAYDDPLVGKDPQPSHMDNYQDLPVTPFTDLGGVHINSGILNHAFYKASKYLGGEAWKSAGIFWYAALRELPGKPDFTTFQDVANITTKIAQDFFEGEPRKQEAVYKAWTEVGLEPQKLSGRDLVNLRIRRR